MEPHSGSDERKPAEQALTFAAQQHVLAVTAEATAHLGPIAGDEPDATRSRRIRDAHTCGGAAPPQVCVLDVDSLRR